MPLIGPVKLKHCSLPILLGMVLGFGCATVHLTIPRTATKNAQIAMNIEPGQELRVKSLVETLSKANGLSSFVSYRRPDSSDEIACRGNDESTCFVSRKLSESALELISNSSTQIEQIIIVSLEIDRQVKPTKAYLFVTSGLDSKTAESANNLLAKIHQEVLAELGEKNVITYSNSIIALGDTHSCKSDSDCALAKGICGYPEAVNKYAVKTYENWVDRQPRQTQCRRIRPTTSWPKNIALKCVTSQCQAISPTRP